MRKAHRRFMPLGPFVSNPKPQLLIRGGRPPVWNHQQGAVYPGERSVSNTNALLWQQGKLLYRSILGAVGVKHALHQHKGVHLYRAQRLVR